MSHSNLESIIKKIEELIPYPKDFIENCPDKGIREELRKYIKPYIVSERVMSKLNGLDKIHILEVFNEILSLIENSGWNHWKYTVLQDIVGIYLYGFFRHLLDESYSIGGLWIGYYELQGNLTGILNFFHGEFAYRPYWSYYIFPRDILLSRATGRFYKILLAGFKDFDMFSKKYLNFYSGLGNPEVFKMLTFSIPFFMFGVQDFLQVIEKEFPKGKMLLYSLSSVPGELSVQVYTPLIPLLYILKNVLKINIKDIIKEDLKSFGSNLESSLEPYIKSIIKRLVFSKLNLKNINDINNSVYKPAPLIFSPFLEVIYYGNFSDNINSYSLLEKYLLGLRKLLSKACELALEDFPPDNTKCLGVFLFLKENILEEIGRKFKENPLQSENILNELGDEFKTLCELLFSHIDPWKKIEHLSKIEEILNKYVNPRLLGVNIYGNGKKLQY